MDAPRQKEMNESATVVATTTFADAAPGRSTGSDMVNDRKSHALHLTIKGEVRELAVKLAETLRRAGHEAWFAGGCVRDRLLGRAVKDYDIATGATPSEVARLFPEAQAVGAHFGVMLVRGVEIATFRSEGAYSDGRHPDDVAFETEPRADAARRDFTINGLMEDPWTGEVLDFVGGQADLRAGLLRAIGDPLRRFREDHLRLMRAVRFAARLGFAVEPATQAAMREEAPLIGRIAAERVRDELTRILTEGGARRGFELMDETGLLLHVLPEIARLKGVEQPPEFHPEGDVWTHTLLMLEALGECEVTLALAVLFHDAGKPETQTRTGRIRFHGHAEAGARIARAALTRLKYPNAVVERVTGHVSNHMRFMDVPRMRESTFKRFVRLPGFDELLELYRLDLVGSLRGVDSYESLKARREALPEESLRPKPLLNGDDLQALGYEPGPVFKEILLAVEEAQLENRISTPEEAVALIRSRFGSA